MNSKSNEIDDLEEAVQKLHIAYERYFLGLERRPPSKDHDDLKRRLRRLLAETPGNTAIRFRHQQLRATVVTYESHWLRICNQIEEGSYFRHRRLAAMRMEAFDEKIRRRKGAAAVEDKPTLQVTAGLLKLYNRYTSEQMRLGQQPISLESLAVTVRDQTSRIKEQYDCSRVDFRVAVKDGKVLLKAAPRKAATEAVPAPAKA